MLRRSNRGLRLAAFCLLALTAAAGGAQVYQVSNAEVTEGDAGTSDLVFTVSLIIIPGTEGCGTISLTYATVPQGATAGVDYTTTTGGDDLNTCGPTSFDVTVPAIGDLIDENNETFLLRVEDGTFTVDGTGTINDDDTTSLSIGDAAVFEGDAGQTTLAFTVSLSNPNAFPISISYATTDGTAIGGVDYLPVQDSIVVAALATEGVIPVEVLGDTLFESDETFVVDIFADGPPVPDGQALGTILTDDARETLSIGDVAVTEGDAGVTTATFNISLSRSLPFDVVMLYATTNGTAKRGSDYRESSGDVRIVAGETAATIGVDVLGDTDPEGDESFFVDIELVAPLETTTGGGSLPDLVDSRGTGTIFDDDQAGVLTVADIEVAEGDTGVSSAIFTVSLSETAEEEILVDFATANGTARADGDYRATAGRVSIPVGATSTAVTIPIEGDTLVEPDETFFLDLVESSGPPIETPRAVATILDDDAVDGLRIAAIGNGAEGGMPGTISVERVGAGGGSAQVSVRLTGGSAQAGADFLFEPTVLSWGPGEGGIRSASVEVIDDNLEEGEETATAELFDPVGASLLSPASGGLTIADNDDAMGVQIVGESESFVTVEGESELSVRVVDSSGAAVGNALVEWQVEGAAELVGESTDRTDSEGVSRRTVEHADVPGTATITATLVATGEVIEFQLVVEGDLRQLFPDSTVSTNEVSVANVLDSACVSATGQFGSFCSYLFTLPGPGDQRSVLGQITPEETPAQGAMSLESMKTQLRNVGSRLAALRGGATRQAVDQLAFQLNGESIPWQSIAAALTDYEEFELPEFSDILERSADAQDEGASETGSDPLDVDADAVSRFGFFINGRVSMGERDGTSGEEGFDVDSTGLTIGVDYRASDTLVWGAALGLLDTDLELAADGGALDAEGTSLAIYGTYFQPAYYIDWVASWGVNDYEVSRNVDLPLPFEGRSRWTALGSPESDQLSLALSGGYDRVAGATTFSLFGRASYVDATIDGYRERGAGPFNLFIREQDVTSLLGEAGIEVSRAWSRSWGVLQPTFRASWLHEFDDDSRLIRGGFLGDLSATEFVVATDAPDRDFFNLGAGLTFVMAEGRSFFVYYDTDLERDDLEIFTLSLGFRWEF